MPFGVFASNGYYRQSNGFLTRENKRFILFV